MEAVLSQSVYITENKNMKKYMYKGKKTLQHINLKRLAH